MVESDEVPIVIDWASVTVSEKNEPEESTDSEEPVELTYWQKFIKFFKDLFNKISEFFNNLF